MSLATIKKEYQTAFVAFGKSGLPLGRRDDIDELAIIALKSGNKNLIKYFDHLPSLDELQEERTSQKLKAISPPPVEDPVEEVPKAPEVPEVAEPAAEAELPYPNLDLDQPPKKKSKT